MSEEENIQQQETPDQLSDILLVLNKDTMKLEAVKGIGKDGQLETVPPTEQNQNQFMRVDNNGNIFSNFFKNFLSQLKNPTQFSFFKVPAITALEQAAEIKQAIDKPSPEGDQVLSKHEVKTDGIKPNEQKESTEQNESPNQNTMENKQAATATESSPSADEYRYKPEDIDWETMSNLGLNREKLEKLKILDPLLKGYKTNELVPISLNLGTAITKLDARLSLQRDPEGKVVMAIHGIRREPTLNYPFFGHEFSKEDKENLLKTGNMGRIVDLTFKAGETVPSIISVDRLTNELIALRADKIKIPDEIKGIKLDDHQKQTLLEGQPLALKGMISKKGEPFDATVQFNADKRYVEFLFDRTTNNRQSQSAAQSQKQAQPGVIPTEFRGHRFSDEQYSQFKEGQTIYLDNIIDRKGGTYQGYVTYNKESGETDFSFKNPASLKDKIVPMESHKTQVSVNSEGKTNESTKHIDKPLNSGQANPQTAKEQQKQNNATRPAKSKGRKV
jgi:hypothetical protein